MAKPIGPLCNLACSYCYYLDKEGLYPAGERFRMADAVLERFVRQYIAANPGPQVDFAWQGGEPTLMGIDFFRRVVALQRRYLPSGWTCHNALQTNGTLLDDAWGVFLREHQFLVGISIDGPPGVHDCYRQDKGGRPTHAAVLRGLHQLQRHGVEHNVLCTVHAANAAHAREVYRFFRSEGVRWLQFIPIVERAGDGTVTDRSVSGEGYGDFLVAVFEEWVRHDVGTVYVQMFEECAAIWAGLPASLCVLRETCGSALAMEHDGELYACDHFVQPAYRLGNIGVTDLGDLVAAPAQVAFGAAKRDALPRLCRECEVRFACHGGCPKDRLATTPDGERGLNHLCAGYRRFFQHVDPYMRRMVALWRQGAAPAAIMGELRAAEWAERRAVGRNEPCPCGSGRKFKHCCLGQRHAGG